MQDHNYIDAPEKSYLYTGVSQLTNAGNGLFTAIDIYKGEVIALFKGEMLTDLQAAKRSAKGKDQYFISLLNGGIMDSIKSKCFAKYANDATGTPALAFDNNSIITLDEPGNVCLTATRNIKAGEEVFCSYGKRYQNKHFEMR